MFAYNIKTYYMKEKYSKNKMFKNTETHTYNSETGEVLSQSKILIV